MNKKNQEGVKVTFLRNKSLLSIKLPGRLKNGNFKTANGCELYPETQGKVFRPPLYAEMTNLLLHRDEWMKSMKE